MPTSKLGAARMHGVVAGAKGDIRHRLWTLYWLARLCREKTKSGVFVELGVRGGDSTRALLCGCLDAEGVLHSYDIEDCSGVIGDPELARLWQFRRKPSAEAGRDWRYPEWMGTFDPKGSAALVFVDTDHTLQTTRAEIAAWAPHVRVGGCLAFHDYWLHDPPRDEHQGHGVKMAVDEWNDAHLDAWELESHDAGPDGDTGLAILWRRA